MSKIGDHAFSHSSLYGVTFPSSLRTIDAYAFSYCTTLENIVLPEGIEEIGEFAFYYCWSSAFWNKGSITLPSSLRSLGTAAFGQCTYIQTVNFSDGLTAIPQSAFVGCISLTELNLPDSVSSIGVEAFSGCQKLTEVSLSDNVTLIGDGAFSLCSGMTQIRLPQGIAELSDNLFSGCSRLQSVDIPSSVVSLGANVFRQCYALQRITIPESVTHIDGNPVAGCPDVELVFPENGPFSVENGLLLSSDGTLIAGLNVRGHVDVPDSVTGIANSAFYSCEELTTIAIPDSVTYIGASAFRRCYGLTGISIPDSVTRIGVGAFVGCVSLASVRLPKGLTRIEPVTLSDCRVLSAIAIPQAVTSIGFSAFEYCSALKTVNIPGAVRTIEANAFYQCPELETVYLYAGLSDGSDADIADSAFYGCSKMSVRAPNGTYPYQWARDHGFTVTDLQYEFFTENDQATIVRYYGMTVSAHVVIPDQMDGYPVTRIGGGAFRGHREMTSVVIPDTVAVIEEEAFIRCGLVTVGGITAMGTYGVTLPQGLMEIGDGAFSFCQLAGSVAIPDTVTRIGQNAFAANANLGPYVAIPGSVQVIGDGAFSHCPRIAEVHMEEGVETIGNNVFAFANGVDLYLPDSLVRFGENTAETALADTTARCFANIDSGMAKQLGFMGFPFNDMQHQNNQYRYLVDGEQPAGLEALSLSATGTEALVLPQGLTKIAAGAMKTNGCVVIPDTVTLIEEDAFPRETESLTVYCNSYALERVRELGYLYEGDLDESLRPDSCTYTVVEHVAVVQGGGVAPTETQKGLSDAVYCEACGCILEKQQELDALGWLVSFDTGMADAAMDGERIQDGGTYALPAYPYEWPDGYEFAGWRVGARQFQPFDSLIVEGNTQAAAVWRPIPMDPPDLMLPVELRTIEEEAFAGTAARVICLRGHVTAIGKRAFAHCENLREIYIPSSVTLIDPDAFAGCSELLWIYGEPDSAAERFARENGFVFVRAVSAPDE